MQLGEWQYSDAIPEERRLALERAPSFRDITELVVRTMHVPCRHVDPCDEVAEYERVVYCAVVDKRLFDLLFNSKNGYRAGYYRSPAEGLTANAEFIGSVAPALLARNFGDQVALDTATKSLSAPSGKLWVAEVGNGFCPKCHGEWKAPEDDSAEILNGRWELSTMPYARYGRKAPLLETIRVFGGFVSKDGREYVPNRKLGRAEDIYECGWS